MKMTETFDSMEKVNGMKRVRNNEQKPKHLSQSVTIKTKTILFNEIH